MDTKIKKEKEIDLNKVYQMPERIEFIHHKGKIIVIAIETGNWIVLENEEQLVFLNLLQEKSIKDALATFNGNFAEAQYVVMQLEAKDFENTKTYLKNQKIGIHIYLTNSCNMRCPHCYMYAGIAKDNELTTKEVCDLLSNFKRYNGSIVIFSGGEICTRSDLFEIVKHTHSLGLSSELLTNGTLWSEKQIKEIAPYISRVQVSIDGYTESVNARVRGKGSFAKALDTIDRFIQSGVHVDVGITPWFDDALKKDYLKYAEFGKELLEKYKDYPFTIKFNDELLEGRELKLTLEQQEEYKDIISRINRECYGDITDIAFIEFHKMKGIENNCEFGNISVNSDGDLFFCAAIPTTIPFANLRKDSFERIMQLSDLAKQISDVNNLVPCKDCELKYICGGDCRVIYFKDLVDCDVEKLTKSPTRKCNKEMKEQFYDLMIRTNHKLFT